MNNIDVETGDLGTDQAGNSELAVNLDQMRTDALCKSYKFFLARFPCTKTPSQIHRENRIFRYSCFGKDGGCSRSTSIERCSLEAFRTSNVIKGQNTGKHI